MKLAALLLLAGLASAQTKPPQLLTDALRRIPGLAILDPTIGLRNPPNENRFEIPPVDATPWIEANFDRDGLPDVAAVVVARGKETRFGVLAVNSREPKHVHWIIPLHTDPEYAISFLETEYGQKYGLYHQRFIPLYCVACDANTWFRWSGRRFESRLMSRGTR